MHALYTLAAHIIASTGGALKNKSLILMLFLLFGAAKSYTQQGHTFDSALQTATATTNDGTRLTRLKALEGDLNKATSAQAITFDEALLATRIRLKDDSGIVISHIRLGRELADAGRYDDALRHLFPALALAERMMDYNRQTDALITLGFAYKGMGEATKNKADLDQAMRIYTQAKALSSEHALTQQEPKILNNMAQLYDLQHESKKALALNDRQITLLRSNGPPAQLVYAYMNRGIFLKNDRQYQASLQSYRHAAALIDSVHAAPVARVFVNDNLANLYHAMGNDEAAVPIALETIRSAEAAGLPPVRIDMLGLLSTIYEAQGNYSEALAASKKASALKDTVLNKEKAVQVAAMQAKYEAGEKDERIAAQAQTIVSGKKVNRYLWAGVVLLALLGAGIYAFQYRLRRLNRQVILQRTELQQLNDVKDRLFSVIGHDLRMPVNSLTSFMVLLEGAQVTPEKLAQYTSRLKQTLGNTSALLENLLHFARTQMQSSKAILQYVNVGGIIANTIQLLEPAITGKNIQVINTIPGSSVALADADMVALIFRNLLSNAIKFSQPGGAIRLSASVANRYATYTVSDEGSGMDPALVAAFNDPGNAEPVIHGSASGTQQEKGTGLGLMLCKTFAALMQGRITAERVEGNGTAFTLALPG